MAAPFFCRDPLTFEPLRRWSEDYGWIILCISIAAICLGGAWTLKTFLMNPEYAVSGWSPLYVVWGIVWIILWIVGLYGILGLCCTRLIDSFSDR